MSYRYRCRTLCDVLDDMRTCDKTKNYASLISLVEEAQMLGNNMENALVYGKDLNELHKQRKELLAKVEKMKPSKDESKQD